MLDNRKLSLSQCCDSPNCRLSDAVSCRPASCFARCTKESTSRSQSRAVLSWLPAVSTHRASGLIATENTKLSWPRSVIDDDTGSSDVKSQTRAVMSALVVASQRPSGLSAVFQMIFVCPSKTLGGEIRLVLLRSQTYTLLSALVTRRRPSALNETERMLGLASGGIGSPIGASQGLSARRSQSRATPSSPPVTSQ